MTTRERFENTEFRASSVYIYSNVSEQRSLKTKGIRMEKRRVWSTLQVPPRAFIQLHIHK